MTDKKLKYLSFLSVCLSVIASLFWLDLFFTAIIAKDILPMILGYIMFCVMAYMSKQNITRYKEICNDR